MVSLNSLFSPAEEESLAEVHKDHSTRSSGVGRDQVISTCFVCVCVCVSMCVCERERERREEPKRRDTMVGGWMGYVADCVCVCMYLHQRLLT
jgi:hypothetical protein